MGKKSGYSAVEGKGFKLVMAYDTEQAPFFFLTCWFSSLRSINSLELIFLTNWNNNKCVFHPKKMSNNNQPITTKKIHCLQSRYFLVCLSFCMCYVLPVGLLTNKVFLFLFSKQYLVQHFCFTIYPPLFFFNKKKKRKKKKTTTTKQNKTKQNKTKQNKTKQNKKNNK